MNFINKITTLLLLAGIGILIYTFNNYKNDNTKNSIYKGHLDTRDHNLPENILPKFIPINNYDALALFVVESEFCSSCINEIIEFTTAISEYLNSPLSRFDVRRHALVVGKDSTDLKRINGIIDFPFSYSLTKRESRVSKKMREWKKDVSGINQIVLININENLVVGRIGIFTSSTPRHFKKNLVQELFYELETNDKYN